MRISPRLISFAPSMIREVSSGVVANSFSGMTPFSLMFVVSAKLLNMPPNLMRGDQAAISGRSFRTASTRFAAPAFMFRFKGRLSMDAT